MARGEGKKRRIPSGIYASPYWRGLFRIGLLRKRYTPDQLERIFKKTRGRCRKCKKRLVFKNYGVIGARGSWEVDHSVPLVRGGSNLDRNLAPLCTGCNRAKADKKWGTW